MNKDFYERCKSLIGKLKLTKEQGIARDVILSMLDMKEEECKDYLTRIYKAIEILKLCNSQCSKEVLEILGGDVDDE